MESTSHWSNPQTGHIVSCISVIVMWCGLMVCIGGVVLLSSDFPNDNPLLIMGPVLVGGGALITVIGALICIFCVKPACCYRERAEKKKEELFSTALSSPSTEYVTTELGGSQAVTPSEAPPLSMISQSMVPRDAPPPGPAYPPRQAPPTSMLSSAYPQREGSATDSKAYLQISDVSSAGYTSGSQKPSWKESEGYSVPQNWSGAKI